VVQGPASRALERLDGFLGDRIDEAFRAHHRRRLRRLGWSSVLAPRSGGGDGWWAQGPPRRDGNRVEILLDGEEALGAMAEAIESARSHVHLAGWHASPDFRLTRKPGDPTLGELLARTADRVPVRLLLWAGPPVPAFEPTRRTVRAAREGFCRDSAVQCALDRRERTMHCHHEKLLVVDDEIAFVGGLDLTDLQGDRHDVPVHEPVRPMGWHDAAVRLRGPAVVDVARHLAARWAEVTGDRLPEPSMPPPAGDTVVQVVRTVPERTYDFLPRGEFSALDAYLHALRSARRFIYLENQFLWSTEVTDILIDKLRNPPSEEFRVLLVLPARPTNGADTTRGQLGRLIEAAGDSRRMLATTLDSLSGGETGALYVHAKVGIIDDRWLTVGSANLNEHSLFNDTEMNIVTCDAALARRTRLRLWAEHLERREDELDGDPSRLVDELWWPIAEEQSARRADGLPRTHRLRLLAHVSRRAARLIGPIRGVLVDG
jgi:phosphatidylserine/phosphatidylglycerophosphate/cardiolipin synthase-like enzyme